MDFVRVVKNSDDLDNIIKLPKGLRNRKVEIIILPFNDQDMSSKDQQSLRGVLSSYKNEALQSQEKEAWSRAAVDNYDNH